MAKIKTLRPTIRTFDARAVKPEAKQVDPFYLSAEWRSLCETIKRERWPTLLARQGHCCEDVACKATHSRQTRIYFDHIKERRDYPELALVKSNIMGRCGSSHTSKTARARAARMGAMSRPLGGMGFKS